MFVDCIYGMEGFRIYVEESEAGQADLKKTLAKLPKAHQDLVKGYSWKFQGGNTLEGDGEHVGLLDSEKKKITIAAPWNYGREYAVLHEIAHLVWESYVDASRKESWQQIVNATDDKQHQSAEELFCMAYATHYAKNKIDIHSHGTWDRFIDQIPK